MDDKELVDLIEHDISGARTMHDDQMSKISEWISAYNGDKIGNEDDNTSNMVWKLIKKQGESLIANLSKPFLGAHEIADLTPLTDKDTIKTPIYSKVLNHFWAKETNSNKLIKSISRLIVKEGTCFIRAGWEKRADVKEQIVPGDIPPALIDKLKSKGAEIQHMDDGKIKIIKKNILVNKPTAKPLRLEDCYFDPTADSFEEIQFFSFDYITSISELRKQPHLYTKEAVDKLERMIDEQDDNQTGSLEESHMYNRYAFKSSNNLRKKIRLNEYWGELDIDNSGITEPAMAVTAKYGDSRVLMRAEKNKLPFKSKPFVCIPLIDKEFSVYGDALAELISDEQKFYTSIVRGIIDNMSNSNNGTKFIRKGALDTINFQRMQDGERVVEVNTNESINAVLMDGTFNQLPGDVYNTLSIIEAQAESLTGVSKMLQGIPGTEMKAASSNFSAMMSQSQIRLLDVTTSLTTGLRKLFYMWLSMSMEYLTDEEIQHITGLYIPELKVKETRKIAADMGIDQLPEETKQKAMMLIIEEVNDMFNMKDLKYDIEMKVGTDGLKDIKISHMNMLMQQAGNLIQLGVVPPKVMGMLFSDMADAMDRPDISREVKNFKHQPDPMQQEMAKAELDKTKAEGAKDKALAYNAMARTKTEGVKASANAQAIHGNVVGKQVDNFAKLSKVKAEDTKVKADAYSKIKGAVNGPTSKPAEKK